MPEVCRAEAFDERAPRAQRVIKPIVPAVDVGDAPYRAAAGEVVHRLAQVVQAGEADADLLLQVRRVGGKPSQRARRGSMGGSNSIL